MAPRHFLDIDRIDAGTLRRIVDMGHAMKAAGKRVPDELKPEGIDADVAKLFKAVKAKNGDSLITFGWMMAEDLLKFA